MSSNLLSIDQFFTLSDMKNLLVTICIFSLLLSCTPSKDTATVELETTLENQEGTRQIHLDFHTSEHIEDIAAEFSKEQFQEALKVGNVNAINIFAKGHHGWSYYDTKVGKMHPHLDFDLMKAQIEACREIGVKVKIYFTVGYSDWEAKAYPEWVQKNKDGSSQFLDGIKDVGPNDSFDGWHYLEPMGAYAEKIYLQTEEIVKNYDIDGIWFDIHTPWRVNYNAAARADYKAQGIDINDEEAVYQRTIERYETFYQKTLEIVQKHKPGISVFWNGTTAEFNSKMLADFKYKMFRFNTKLDLEDLPTAWFGYDVFPWRSKYFAATGKDIVAMSGKFHTAWGEFGGFKSKDALRYEVASMVAYGANINIGDQLHPSGEMDMSTYENIGYAFEYAKKIESYGVGAQHLATTGLYVGGDKPALEGAVAMLVQNQINFNVVNLLDDWSDIEVLVLTSDGILERDQQRLDDFVARGGKVIAFGKGAFRDGKSILPIGATYLGEANYDVDYTVVNDQIAENLVRSPFLNYNPAVRVKPSEGTEVLARLREPYFSRTLSHFSSHQNTPFRLEDAPHPAVIRNGNVIYFAHDLDKQFKEMGLQLHRDLFHNAFQLLQTKAFVKVSMQSMGRVNLLHQPDKNRYVVHLLYASPIQRGKVRVIEDLPTVYDIPVSVDFPETIKRAYLVPSGELLTPQTNAGRLEVVVPELTCHTAVVFEY
ncbi:alpha-amylase family protein [Marinoscillum furvescens]|uniref:Putative glycosyl hydrolase-like family 6 (GHL6) protein n=1 Tax=Marinoscillum furvescens DSM 4134 TaxID=1122208 RepID=A0A3D9L620_MARFU|nr:alpha-L-fucosidase [Marinoscillum furvescens]REE01544.1 putative glycosyl hydrolase-like family 6 (GHL6) protein [Marinoscillum furvescens DSM 4134]